MMGRWLAPLGAACALLCCLWAAAQEAAEKKTMEDYVFPVAGQWEGGSEEAQPAGIRWEFGRSKQVFPRQAPRDWTPYSGVAFTLVTNKKSESKLYLLIGSENPNEEGSDYYSLRINLDFEGAKDFLIPLDELGKARSPVGFHKIDYLRFHNRWDPNDPIDQDLVVTIRGLRLVSETNLPKVGPRMSDKQLFDALDLAAPGLEKVKAAVEMGDTATARHELAEHIRHRPQPRWFKSAADRPTLGMPAQTGRAEKGAGGRYRATVKADWTGWKKVTLAKADFQPQGKPIGWNWISRLSLNAHVKGDAGGITLFLDDCKLTGAQGERSLGDFESEATGWENIVPSKEQAHSGTGSGKWWFLDVFPSVGCGKAPADWTKYDGLELWVHAPGAPNLEIMVSADSYLPDTEYADMILTHKFYIGSFKNNVFDFGKRFDWSCNAMSEGESKTVEWNAQLNRHFHFAQLIRAYWQTGDEKYARELAQEMNAWVEDNPVFLINSGNSPYHHAWETLNTACRLQSTWPEAIFSCILSPEFTDDIVVNILKSVAEQARHLIKNPTSGNWLTAESLGVYTMGVLFPEYKEAKDWRRIGIERLYNQLNEEVYPDGLEYEVALGYNNWVLSEYIRILELAKLNGRMEEVPRDYKGRIEKMFNYLMYDCMPDGVAVGLNDSGNANVKNLLLDGYRYFPGRPDFVYAISAGKNGKRPPCDSIAMPYTGHYIMRSGWDRDARMLHMDGGLFGYGHQHEDKLHVAMYAYGKQLLPDSGNFMYDRSRWRAYVLLTRSHNTILVDGMDQFLRRTPEARVWPKPWDAPSPPTDTRWVSVHGLDYAIGLYKNKYREYLDDQHPIKNPRTLETVQHTRRVLFAKPDFWVVHDTLTATDGDEHTYDVLFHINAEEATVDPKTNAVVSTCKDAPNVALAPLNVEGLKGEVVKGKVEPPIQGWTNCGGKRTPEHPMAPIPTAIFHKTWRTKTDVVTVIYPFPADAQSPLISVTPIESTDGSLAAKIALQGGVTHVYFANAKPGSTAEQAGVKTDGEVAEACLQPGKDFRLLLVNGSQLSVGEASVAMAKAGSLSVTGYGDGIYCLGADAACECSVKIPGFGDGTKTEVHRVDHDLSRLGKVEVGWSGGVMKLATEAGATYEITPAGRPGLKEILKAQAAREASKTLGLDFPVCAMEKLPPSAGVKVVVQAEDIAAQGGGTVEVTDQKVAIDGKAFLRWDKAGHYLEYKFCVPADGEYWITLKYCTENAAPLRALVVDGALPAECMKQVEFAGTGGWSTERDDWRLWTVADPATRRPFPFFLRKGDHTLRLVNVQESMNLDYLVIHSPDVGVK